MGSELALATGEAFDVKVKTTVQSRERLSSSKWRTSMRYEISNAKTQPISVDLTQAALDFVLHDTSIIEESEKSQRISSDAARWIVNVTANGSMPAIDRKSTNMNSRQYCQHRIHYP